MYFTCVENGVLVTSSVIAKLIRWFDNLCLAYNNNNINNNILKIDY